MTRAAGVQPVGPVRQRRRLRRAPTPPLYPAPDWRSAIDAHALVAGVDPAQPPPPPRPAVDVPGNPPVHRDTHDRSYAVDGVSAGTVVLAAGCACVRARRRRRSILFVSLLTPVTARTATPSRKNRSPTLAPVPPQRTIPATSCVTASRHRLSPISTFPSRHDEAFAAAAAAIRAYPRTHANEHSYIRIRLPATTNLILIVL